uniref:30S ribosomal protein S6, chloroplastic n=1 Tax=Cyanidium sp. THAL103 TaxID=3027999 RepID=A0A9Y1MYA1_9RHOD|nr:ribosomal protein S6 [Cyanidium sp. THAL103]
MLIVNIKKLSRFTSYELIVAVRPDIEEEMLFTYITQIKHICNFCFYSKVNVEHRGHKKLSYKMSNFTDAIYLQFTFKAYGKIIGDIFKYLKLNEDILRYSCLKVA